MVSYLDVTTLSHLLGTLKLTLQTFLAVQLDRLTYKPPTHAPGPKRPTLAQVEAERNGK